MASKNVIEITRDNFEAEVVKAAIPVMVDFWAPWCGPCVMLGPTIDRLADKYAGKVKVGKCNTDENMELASDFGISGIPRVLFFKGSATPVESLTGLQQEPAYAQILDKLVAG